MADKSDQQPQSVSAGQQASHTDVKLVRKFEQILQERIPGILKNIPQEKRSALARASFQASEMLVIHQGPLPDPETLAKYGEIIPEGADRIMRMAEGQSQHRIELEKTIVGSQQGIARRGQVFALIIGIFGIGVAAYLAMNGHDAVAGIIGGTTVVSLAVAFIAGRRIQQKELHEKAGKGPKA